MHARYAETDFDAKVCRLRHALRRWEKSNDRSPQSVNNQIANTLSGQRAAAEARQVLLYLVARGNDQSPPQWSRHRQNWCESKKSILR